MFRHRRGIAPHDDIVRDVLGDDCTGGDDSVITDGYAGVESRPPTDPDVVANSDWFAVFEAFDSLGCVDRMGRGVDVDTRADLAVPTDIHLADAQDDAVEIL